MDNTVTVIGNVTRDPELKFTPSGMGIATLGIAVNRVWTDKQTNERKEQVSFLNVKAWGSLGENVVTSIVKGNRVVVTGRLEQRSWESDGGEKRSAVEIVADDIAPSLRWATCQVHRNERNEGGGQSRPAPSAPATRPAPNDEEPF